jgi:hypothetical protein
MNRLECILAPLLDLFGRVEARCYMRLDAVAIARGDASSHLRENEEFFEIEPV